ncbi:hypothetical protein FB567DRAFT_614262 [Paraphoma chrysanthemicola]|uniref:Uncharacterized protein n=1 Tax=Paraphoma chrysanthemicola TaxID=798071 RepID=A0A8K0RGS4_9PLEO|nr:hypothetical protein FB567DRAFT_614262 [Paraphoma chrysanthemicola]
MGIAYDFSNSPENIDVDSSPPESTAPASPTPRSDGTNTPPTQPTPSINQRRTASASVHFSPLTWEEVAARWVRESAPEPESRPRVTITPGPTRPVATEPIIRRVYARPDQIVPGGPYIDSYGRMLYQDRAGHEHEQYGEGRRRPWDIPITHVARQRAARNLLATSGDQVRDQGEGYGEDVGSEGSDLAMNEGDGEDVGSSSEVGENSNEVPIRRTTIRIFVGRVGGVVRLDPGEEEQEEEEEML